MLPDYFFRVAASSTGKYHPTYALGDGGLVRHTKAALHIAHDLLALEQYQLIFSRNMMDCILAAIMLHDGWKHGAEASAGRFTAGDHPVVAAKCLRESEALRQLVSEQELETIAGAIESHMGQWNTDYKSKKEIMPKPVTDYQKFVHLCDYLASRKYLLFDFGDSYYKPEDFEVSVTKEDKARLIELCKKQIAVGANRDKIYEVIMEHNDGRKNPNTLADKAAYDTIYRIVEEMGSESKTQ